MASKEFMLCGLGDPNYLSQYTNHIAEIKEDGRRIFIKKSKGIVTLIGREPIRSKQYPEIVKDTYNLEGDFILDCELIVRDSSGKSDFGLLMSLDRTRDSFKLKLLQRKYKVVARVFDIISINGQDIQKEPLLVRKERLKRINLQGSLEMVESFKDIQKLYNITLGAKEEGIVIKYNQGLYNPGKRDWVKIKRVLQSDIIFNSYEENNKGITVTNQSGFRCLVAGQNATEVKRLIDTQGVVSIEVNHLGDPGVSGKLRQITFSKVK